jgi:hypothetical protein
MIQSPRRENDSKMINRKKGTKIYLRMTITNKGSLTNKSFRRNNSQVTARNPKVVQVV